MRDRLIPAVFLMMLTAGLLLFLIMPKSGKSEAEGRELAKPPKFTLANAASGNLTKEIDDYIKDHFPFRESLITVGDGLGSAFKYKSDDSVEVIANAVTEDMGVGENLQGTDGAAPEAEPEEPLPEAAHIDVAEEADYNSHGIIISGIRAMEIFGYYPEMLTNYASTVNAIKACLPDVNVYSIVAPTSGEFYSPVKFHTEMHSQKDAITQLYSELSPDVTPVDAYTYVASVADQYVYFRTDHHWTARGAYEGYYAFCKASEQEAAPLESFETAVVADDFVGSLYRYAKRQVLKDYPDYVEVFYQPMVESSEAYYSADMTGQYEASVISDPSGTTNKYLAFLGGDHPLMHIVTTNKNGRRLVVLKDSFGNALVPFMTNNYEEIFVIDPRSASLSLSEFCAAHQINDLLVENYAFAISNSAILNGLKAMAY